MTAASWDARRAERKAADAARKQAQAAARNEKTK